MRTALDDRVRPGPIRRAPIGVPGSRCLVCYRYGSHPLHGKRPKKMDQDWGVVWWGNKPALDGYFFHDFDPGERRISERRRKWPH